MSARNRSTTRWRRTTLMARRRPVSVSSTPRYGAWATRPASARRLTVVVMDPGVTRNEAARSPVRAAPSAPSLEVSRHTAFNVSRSDFDRAGFIILLGGDPKFPSGKSQDGIHEEI